jgi:hypothetical protein
MWKVGVCARKRLLSLALAATVASFASASQAAMYRVDVSGTETITIFYGDGCWADEGGCETTYSLDGTYLFVTTPAAGDGVFKSGITLAYDSGNGFSGDSFLYAGPGIEVDVLGSSLLVFGTVDAGETFDGSTFFQQFGSSSAGDRIEASLGPGTPVPEPASGPSMLAALALIACGTQWVRRRRRSGR